MKNIMLNHRKLSEESKPFIIAEIGVNYYDIAVKNNVEPIEAAKLMITEAKDAGADAVKFQSYKAEKIASRCSPAYWDTTKESTKSQYELFKKYDLFGEDEYRELAKYAGKENVIFVSTPFDEEAVDYLNELMPFFKISSSDITNLPFIKYIACKEKPVFLSTGASTVDEVKYAVNTIESQSNSQIAILHCILNYPTKYEDANLGMIRHIKEIFEDYLVGYSDHTLPDPNMLVLTTAVLFGAKIIEKHFTLDKNLSGNDHYHSMDPHDLKIFVQNLEMLEQIIGNRKKEPLENEKPARMYARRSLVARRNIPIGKIIEKEDLVCKRPGTGISPSLLEKIIGETALDNIIEDEILTYNKISLKGKNLNEKSI